VHKFPIRQRQAQTEHDPQVDSQKQAHGAAFTQDQQQQARQTCEEQEHQKRDVRDVLFWVDDRHIAITLEQEEPDGASEQRHTSRCP